MATIVEFASTVKLAFAELAAACTARNGSGQIYTLQDKTGVDYVAPTKGARLERVTVSNAQASPAAASANQWALFIWDAGANKWRLAEEKLQAAATRSVTVLGQRQQFSYYQQNGLNLEAGAKIGICQHVYAGAQDLCVAVAEIEEYT